MLLYRYVAVLFIHRHSRDWNSPFITVTRLDCRAIAVRLNAEVTKISFLKSDQTSSGLTHHPLQCGTCVFCPGIYAAGT